MFAHNSVAVIPICILLAIMLGIANSIIVGYIQEVKGRIDIANYVNLAFIIVGIIIIAFGSFRYESKFVYIPKPIVFIAIIIDIAVLWFWCTYAWRTLAKPVMENKNPWNFKDRTPLVVWAIMFVAFVSLNFFTFACMLNWDWAFRPLVGDNVMEYIAEKREDDSINRADREEQDYWNSHANTIQD